MWIAKVALNRPYTFIVLALLILIAAPVVILRTPAGIFPNINIPVVSIGWRYTGLNPEELEGRLTSPYEKALTTLVDDDTVTIENIERLLEEGYSLREPTLVSAVELSRERQPLCGPGGCIRWPWHPLRSWSGARGLPPFALLSFRVLPAQSVHRVQSVDSPTHATWRQFQ
jgi:hypothetical protein